MGDIIKVPKFTLKRLPLYHRVVQRYYEKSEEYISSETIAAEAQVNPVQVRKDMTIFNASGYPGLGYNVQKLKARLDDLLGLNNDNSAILIGCGKLGRAILGYSGFERYGLSIVACFDNDRTLIGQTISGKEIFDTGRLKHIISRIKVKVAILTVSPEAAQQVADMVVAAGIRAIWNFSPMTLKVPDDVVVKNEDLAVGLATLFHYLK